MRNIKILVAILATGAASVSCGDVVRQGKSPVLLVVDSVSGSRGNSQGDTKFTVPLISDVLTVVTSPSPCSTTTPCPTIFNDLGQAVLRTIPKDVTNPIGPTSNGGVTLSRYRIVYTRADGRNTQGVDVPWAWDGVVSVTVPAGGTATVPFELVKHVAKQEAPLAELVYSPQILTAFANVTFYGQDLVGNEISVTGRIQIDFGNFGDF